eukprot:GHVS01022920.1.p1 GENE.GHVS01022920.1~~GHVS01022920.1.p1  ORF type:complete len:279 (+),score=62.40 GHVS01022920.1:48-839(+)
MLSAMTVCRNLLQLGQLSSAWEGISFFCEAVQRLSQPRTDEGTEGVVGDRWASKEEIGRMVCGAYCSMAEIFMTDLCDEEQAESQCLENIQQALLTCPHHFEAHSTLAQFQKIVGDVEEAVTSAQRAMQILRTAADDEDEESMPSLEVRVNFSRTLIDLNEASDAIEVLEGCLKMDEEDLQVWYVFGCALLVSGDADGALEAAEKAKQCLEQSALSSDPRCTMCSAVYELIQQVKLQLAKEPVGISQGGGGTGACVRRTQTAQ